MWPSILHTESVMPALQKRMFDKLVAKNRKAASKPSREELFAAQLENYRERAEFERARKRRDEERMRKWYDAKGEGLDRQ